MKSAAPEVFSQARMLTSRPTKMTRPRGLSCRYDLAVEMAVPPTPMMIMVSIFCASATVNLVETTSSPNQALPAVRMAFHLPDSTGTLIGPRPVATCSCLTRTSTGALPSVGCSRTVHLPSL